MAVIWNSSTVICIIVLIILQYFGNVDGRENYTEEEIIAIEKFRDFMGDALYKDYMKSDVYLIRWLRAQKFNLNDASEMLKRALDWRKENNIDNIANETIFEFQSSPFYSDGVDYEGGTVFVASIARVDLRNYLLNNKRTIAIRYFHQLLEKYEIQVLTSLGIVGNNSRSGSSAKGTLIIDLLGFNLRQHGCLPCVGVYLEFARLLSDYYPGYNKHILGINAPRIASPLIELIKPLLSEEYRDILQIYGQNQAEWITTLHKIVPPDQLRHNLGGTKVK